MSINRTFQKSLAVFLLTLLTHSATASDVSPKCKTAILNITEFELKRGLCTGYYLQSDKHFSSADSIMRSVSKINELTENARKVCPKTLTHQTYNQIKFQHPLITLMQIEPSQRASDPRVIDFCQKNSLK